MKKVKYYQEELLELVLNIKDILLIKLRLQDIWLYYHIQSNRKLLLFLCIKKELLISSF